MMHLLNFLQRQCSRFPRAESEFMRSSTICDRLLELSTDIHDPEVLRELYMAMVDLKDRGCKVTRQLAEARIYQVAEELCQGLSVQQWIIHSCHTFSQVQIGVLRTFFELPVTGAGTWFGKAKLAPGCGMDHFSNQELVSAVEMFGQSYVSEHIYLQRLQLLHLAILVAPPLPASYRATRVLAAWRVLRSKDAASEAAVIEVLDSMLPVHLKGVVLPLLDSSPLDKKLSVVGAIPGGDVSKVFWKKASRPPRWASDWFKSSMSMFGMQFYVMLTQTAGHRAGDALPPQALDSTLLPKMFLISRVNLYSGLLSIHLAEMAVIATVRHCQQGTIRCQKGETYVIAEGSFLVPLTGQTLNEGDVMNELQVICK